MSLIQFTVSFTVLITFAELCNWSNQNNRPNSLLSSIPPFATLEKEKKTGASWLLQRLLGLLIGTREKIGQ